MTVWSYPSPVETLSWTYFSSMKMDHTCGMEAHRQNLEKNSSEWKECHYSNSEKNFFENVKKNLGITLTNADVVLV